MADAIMQGFLTDGTKSVNFAANASCDGVPSGSIAGTFDNIFTGGPVLNNFAFASATPLLLGVNEVLNLIHIVYENVIVRNITTGELFTGGTAIVKADTTTDTTWEGSITVLFDTHTLTFFGLFTGVTIENATVLCQQLL